ncbi:hypothetical protein BH11BAC7_BH11BAC7_20590 [soil metagenome]
MMRIFIGFIFCLALLSSCRSRGATNKYIHAKHHPAEELAKEQKKASNKAQKDCRKTQKKNKKAMGKKGGMWSKKKKQYTK